MSTDQTFTNSGSHGKTAPDNNAKKVADVTKFLDQVLRSTPEILIRAVSSLAKEYVTTASFGKNLQDLGQLGLLDGIMPSHLNSAGMGRLTKSRAEKTALADFVFKECGLKEIVDAHSRMLIRGPQEHPEPDSRRLFLESGSSIAYPIGVLAKSLSKVYEQCRSSGRDQQWISDRLLSNYILTNNVLGLTALAGLASTIVPIQGRLDIAYVGLFPFGNHIPSSSDGWLDEIDSFVTLMGQIAKTDLVYTTCSNYSLLVGPLVGSRSNALVKRAIHSGRELWKGEDKKAYYLLLDYTKLVPIESVPHTHSFKLNTPKEHCFQVFPTPNESAMWSRVLQQRSSGHSVASGRSSIENWHTGVADRAIRLPFQESPNCALTKLGDVWKRNPHRTGTHANLTMPWINIGLNDHILIAAPAELGTRQEWFVWFEREIRTANDILGFATDAEYSPRNNMKSFPEVVHLQLRPRIKPSP
jgi:hypothetical protein